MLTFLLLAAIGSAKIENVSPPDIARLGQQTEPIDHNSYGCYLDNNCSTDCRIRQDYNDRDRMQGCCPESHIMPNDDMYKINCCQYLTFHEQGVLKCEKRYECYEGYSSSWLREYNAPRGSRAGQVLWEGGTPHITQKECRDACEGYGASLGAYNWMDGRDGRHSCRCYPVATVRNVVITGVNWKFCKKIEYQEVEVVDNASEVKADFVEEMSADIARLGQATDPIDSNSMGCYLEPECSTGCKIRQSYDDRGRMQGCCPESHVMPNEDRYKLNCCRYPVSHKHGVVTCAPNAEDAESGNLQAGFQICMTCYQNGHECCHEGHDSKVYFCCENSKTDSEEVQIAAEVKDVVVPNFGQHPERPVDTGYRCVEGYSPNWVEEYHRPRGSAAGQVLYAEGPNNKSEADCRYTCEVDWKAWAYNWMFGRDGRHACRCYPEATARGLTPTGHSWKFCKKADMIESASPPVNAKNLNGGSQDVKAPKLACMSDFDCEFPEKCDEFYQECAVPIG